MKNNIHIFLFILIIIFVCGCGSSKIILEGNLEGNKQGTIYSINIDQLDEPIKISMNNFTATWNDPGTHFLNIEVTILRQDNILHSSKHKLALGVNKINFELHEPGMVSPLDTNQIKFPADQQPRSIPGED